MAIKLRIFSTFILLGVTIVLGWQQKSPWLILILACIYTSSYISGKWPQLSLIKKTLTVTNILKYLSTIYCIQIIIVSVFFFSTMVLSFVTTKKTIQWSLGNYELFLAGVSFLILTVLNFSILKIEKSKYKTKIKKNENKSQEDSIDNDLDEFKIVKKKITTESFYTGLHFSRADYTHTALSKITDFKGDKPLRTPKAASEDMIKKTEQRLGVKLPETLRLLYKIQNGGGTDALFVPIKENPQAVYEDWMGAFAHDYDVLHPLEDLETLYASYMQSFDPDYDDPKDKNNWIKDSDRLVCFSSRTGYGSALDYRSGEEPGVLLFDHNNTPDKFEVVHFKNFDSFLNACCLLEFGHDVETVNLTMEDQPDPLKPDDFWGLTGNPTPQPITDEIWKKSGEALGVSLPPELFPYYQAADGGQSIFCVAIDEDNNSKALTIFPEGPYVKKGNFLKLEQWVSLETLSKRLNFIDNRAPWHLLYDNPEKLIVISAAFDGAILLDYRKSSLPSVLSISDLDKPETRITFASVKIFLSKLRRLDPTTNNKILGDSRLSSRKAHLETFWLKSGNDPASEKVYKNLFLRLKITDEEHFPKTIENLYKIQNGGQVRYRWAPPQTITATNYVRTETSAPEWQDIFPNGLNKMEDWVDFKNWRKDHKIAMKQNLSDFTDRISFDIGDEKDDEDLKIEIIVIGVYKSNNTLKLTLLDLSKDFFHRNKNIITVDYKREEDLFKIVWGPVYCDNVHSGLLETVRALKDEF